jgi:hypothetical protein
MDRYGLSCLRNPAGASRLSASDRGAGDRPVPTGRRTNRPASGTWWRRIQICPMQVEQSRQPCASRWFMLECGYSMSQREPPEARHAEFRQIIRVRRSCAGFVRAQFRRADRVKAESTLGAGWGPKGKTRTTPDNDLMPGDERAAEFPHLQVSASSSRAASLKRRGGGAPAR